MVIFLINSPIFLEGKGNDLEDSIPPIGLAYIASYLENKGLEVELIDAVDRGLSLKDLIELINFHKPEFIGLNIFSTNYELVRLLVESVTITSHFLIGGLATKSLYLDIIEWKTDNKIDIVIGDGELITFDIIKKNIKENAYYAKRKRRVFKVSENSVYFFRNISEISLNRHFLPKEPICNYYGIPEANIVTSRGCIYNCAFCAAARSQNREFGVRERSAQSIQSELNEIKTNYPKVSSIRILDDLFLKSRQSITKATDIFSKFDFQWRSMACIRTFNHLEQKVINALHRSGCNEIFTGIESGSSVILKSLNKTLDKNSILMSLEKIFRAGISVKGYFIYGFPDETVEDMDMTFSLASEIKALSFRLRANFRTSVFQFRPYHGTEIFRKLKEKNIEVGQITPNKDLSKLIGREQFNFSSGNYSKVELSTLLDYISRTNSLNGSRTITGRIPKPHRPKQKQKM